MYLFYHYFDCVHVIRRLPTSDIAPIAAIVADEGLDINDLLP